MGILGRTRPNVGSMPIVANGAIAAGRVVVGSTPNTAGQQRGAQGAVSSHATLDSAEKFLGIAPEAITDGAVGEVINVPGQRVRAVAGAAVAANKRLTWDANGKLIELTVDTAKFVVSPGFSVEAAAGLDSEFALIIDPKVIGPNSFDAAGDLNAAGGYRKDIGPFVQDNLAANQAAVAIALGATAAPQRKWVAKRAGSITGISASLTVAAAGSVAHAIVRKNGVATTVDLPLDPAVNGGLKNKLAVAKDTVTFAAGDDLDVTITTDGAWSAVTADLAVFVEVEE